MPLRRQTGKKFVYIFDENRKPNAKPHKSANRNEQQTGTKTENPDAPLLSIACLRPWWHYTTLLSTAVKAITWSFEGEKKLSNEHALHYVT